MIAILVIIFGIGLVSYAIFNYVQGHTDYEERVRHEVMYNINKYLEPYQARQNELYTKVLEHDEIIVAHPVFRKKLIQKYKNLQTGEIVEKEVWR